MPHHVERPDGTPPTNGYSHVVTTTGRLVFVSGQVPLDAEGALVGADDPEAQARQVFANIAAALRGVGASMDNLVKLGFYLTDLADLPVVRKVRDEVIGTPPPASTLVQVAGLVHPAFRVEIDAVAEL